MTKTLQRFDQYRPTAFDSKGVGVDGDGDWLVLPLIQTRDSDTLERSNFACCIHDLTRDGVEHSIERFGHWGPGWFEIIIIHPSYEQWGLNFAKSMSDYPIVDEDHWSQLEWDEAIKYWDAWQWQEFRDDHFIPALVDLLDYEGDADDLADFLDEMPDFKEWIFDLMRHYNNYGVENDIFSLPKIDADDIQTYIGKGN